ncbi:hypothetical protein MD484_g5132, partial [Candolleomyces efflorescens]
MNSSRLLFKPRPGHVKAQSQDEKHISIFLPEELWQHIFCFVGRQHLDSLCLVCRRWRSVAMACSQLWASIPQITIPSRRVTFSETTNLEIWLRERVRRSRDLPISFQLDYEYSARNPAFLDSTKACLFNTLAVLVEESHRWQEISLFVPLDCMFALSPIQGNLLSLSKLELFISGPMESGDWNDPINCFASAPLLRHVKLRAPATALQLPWTQLETFTDRTGDHYQKLAYYQSKELRVFDSFVHVPVPLPSETLSAAKIHTLRLQFFSVAPVIQQHLEGLTLPMLRDLELRLGYGRFSGFPIVYGRILRLIRRSDCALTRLVLDHAGDENVVDLRTMLSLCPHLTELAVQITAEEHVLEVVPSTVLPKLKILTLFMSESVAGQDDSGIPGALQQLLLERMEGLPLQPLGQQLEVLRLSLQHTHILEDSLVLRNLQRWLASPDEPISPPESFRSASNLFTQWGHTLEWTPIFIRNERNNLKRMTPLLSLHRTLKTLERQALDTLDLQAFIVSSSPFLRRACSLFI